MNQTEYAIVLQEQLWNRCSLSEEMVTWIEAARHGRLGEAVVKEELQKFRDQAWSWWSDLDLVINGQRVQVDLILVLGKTVYLLEVKYYQADLTYREGNWYYQSGQRYVHDILGQVRRARNLVTWALGSEVNVQSVLIFAHPHMHIQGIEEITDVTVLMRHQVHKFLRDLPNYSSPEWIMEGLLSYQSPYRLEWTEDLASFAASARPGILCPRCHRPYTTKTHQQYHCNHCGTCEYKDDALIRTVWHWCVLNPDQTVSGSKITTFCGETATLQSVYRAIRKVCPLSDRSGYPRYLNPCRQFIRLEK